MPKFQMVLTITLTDDEYAAYASEYDISESEAASQAMGDVAEFVRARWERQGYAPIVNANPLPNLRGKRPANT